MIMMMMIMRMIMRMMGGQAGTMAHLQGLTCMILGLIPVLAEEVRGAPYSSCWSSQVVLMEVK